MGEAGIMGGAGPHSLPFKVDMSNIYSYNIFHESSNLAGLVVDSIDGYMNTNGNPWPLFVILQAFNQKGASTWPFMPTPAQIRGQMYAAITHGATGLWLFVGLLNDTSGQGEQLTGLFPGTPQWDAASQVNHEIDAYKKIYLSKTATDEYHVEYDRKECEWFETKCENVRPPIHTLLKDTGEQGVRYLLAVNLEGYKSASGRFTFTDKPTRVTSLFDNRPVTYSDTKFTDNFEPYGVRLYKIEFNAPSSKTCTVSSASSSINTNQSVTVNFSGNNNNNVNAGVNADYVNLWIQRADGGSIDSIGSCNVSCNSWSGADNCWNACNSSYSPSQVKSYSQGRCLSSGDSSCSGSKTLSGLPTGIYTIHCDLQGSSNLCSGAPHCSYEGGSWNCSPYISCSSTDHISLTVNNPPTPTPIPCNNVPINCGGWSSCSESCGGGTQRRTCYDQGCARAITQTQVCNTQACPTSTPVPSSTPIPPTSTPIPPTFTPIPPSPTPTPIPGDIDHNGRVNIHDYNRLIGDFGKTGSPGFIPADIYKNGKVDIYDYNILVGNFGR